MFSVKKLFDKYFDLMNRKFMVNIYFGDELI